MGANIMAERIVERSSAEMYMEDQCKYAIFVDRRRALPELRDGLKTVQRRILYVAYQQGMISPNKREKSTSLVGELMKHYHPHGDGVYQSIVTLASWYGNKMPLIYGHGNWGNVSGDGAAASRYTECSLSPFGYEVLLQELSESQNVVNWLDTFKRNGIKEPEYLPVKVPLLLVNGCAGIGVGIAVSIPTHNLGEVIDATINLIHNPNYDPILIPDLCQACELVDADWKMISHTGNGSFKARGKIEVEENKKGNLVLHIRSLPDGVSTGSVYEKILKMKEAGQLPMLKDIFDVLDKEGRPDIQIVLKQGSDPGYIKQVLYAKTEVQKSYSVNFEAVDVDGISVRRFGYKEYLMSFLKQRMAIKFRLYCNKLQKGMTRYHYIDAFTKVLESGQIDKIIDMIKKSEDDENTMVEKIIKMCNVTDIQAKFILDANLKKLSKSNLKAYREERQKLQDNILMWQNIVTDDGSYIMKEIEQELIDIKAKYGTPRLCNVIDKAEQNDIPKGTFKIVVTEKNYIRKIPDVEKINIVRKDNPKFILKVDNAENILLFDNKGKVFNLPVHRIPITEKSAAGTDIRILIQGLTADIVAVYYVPTLKKISESTLKHHFVVLSKFNAIKRLDIEDFLAVSPSGLIYSKIRPEDEVVGVVLAPHNLDLVVCSDKKALRYPVEDVGIVKRNAVGVKNMDTDEPIESLTVVYPETEWIVVVTKNAKFNKFSSEMLERHHRAQKGCQVIKLDSNDQIFGIYAANEQDNIRLITSEGVEEVPVAEIKAKSKIAAGTKMTKSKGIILKADVVRQ